MNLSRDPDPAVPPPAAPSDPAGAEVWPHAPSVDVGGRPNASGFVRLVLVVTFFITLACASLIFYRNLHSRFPTSFILLVPTGEEPMEETEVTISDGQREIATIKLTAANHPAASVLLEPGVYSVTMRQHGTVLRQQVFVPHRRQVVVPIPTHPVRPP